MQLELKHMQARLGISFIYVTHDQEEALVMSDRVAVMDSGRLQQLGTPSEIFERPANPFVAEFLGTANFLEGRITEAGSGRCRVELPDGASIEARGRPRSRSATRWLPRCAPRRSGSGSAKKAFPPGSTPFRAR